MRLRPTLSSLALHKQNNITPQQARFKYPDNHLSNTNHQNTSHNPGFSAFSRFSGFFRQKQGQQGLTLTVVLLATFSTNLSLTILTAVTDNIADEFGTEVTSAAWVTLAPMIVSALLTPGVGRAADTYGRKRVWMLGMGIGIIGMVGCALAPSLPALIFSRILTGAGTAITIPSGMAIATAAYPPEKRGGPVGLFQSILAFSPGVGLVLGGALADTSWRAIFWAQIPFSLLALALATLIFTEQKVETTEKFNLVGAMLGAGMLVGGLLAILQGPAWGITAPATIATLALALICGPLFIWEEKNSANPVLPIKLLTEDRLVTWACAVRGIANLPYLGSFIVLPLLLINVHEWETGTAAFALIARPAAMAIFGPIAGALINRGRSPSLLCAVGGITITIGITWLGFLDIPSASPGKASLVSASLLAPLLTCALIFKGAGLGLLSTGAATIVTQRANDQDLGAVSSVLAIVQTVANTAGIAIMLTIVQIGNGAPTEAEQAAGVNPNPEAYTFAFLIAGSIALLATLSAWQLHRLTKAGNTTSTSA